MIVKTGYGITIRYQLDFRQFGLMGLMRDFDSRRDVVTKEGAESRAILLLLPSGTYVSFVRQKKRTQKKMRSSCAGRLAPCELLRCPEASEEAHKGQSEDTCGEIGTAHDARWSVENCLAIAQGSGPDWIGTVVV